MDVGPPARPQIADPPARPSSDATVGKKQRQRTKQCWREDANRYFFGTIVAPSMLYSSPAVLGDANWLSLFADSFVEDPLLPVFPNKYVVGWPPDSSRADRKQPALIRYERASEVLTRDHNTDAHFAGYCRSDVAHRLRKDAAELTKLKQGQLDVASEGAGVAMVVFGVDVDCSIAHSADEHGVRPAASDGWWRSEVIKIKAMERDHAGLHAYRSRGGYRLLLSLARPFVIHNEADGEEWRRRYLLTVASLYRRHRILADPRCATWSQPFRAPHATREGNQAPDRYESIPSRDAGGRFRLGTLHYTPTWEDLAAARELVELDRAATLSGDGSTGWAGVAAFLGFEDSIVRSRSDFPSTIVERTFDESRLRELVNALVVPVSVIKDGRNELYGAIGGALRRVGLAPELVKAVAYEVARQAKDRGAKKRADDAMRSAEAAADGRPAKGLKTLYERKGRSAAVADAIRHWRDANADVPATLGPDEFDPWGSRLPMLPQMITKPGTVREDGFVSLEQAGHHLDSIVTDALEIVRQNPTDQIVLVDAMTGLGKTRAARGQLAPGDTIFSPYHTLADEQALHLASEGREHHRLFGIRSAPEFSECVYHERVAPLLTRGINARHKVCPSCIHKDDYRREDRSCPAYRGRDGDRGIALPVHAHGPTILGGVEPSKHAFVVDELPPLVDMTPVDLEQLATILGPSSASFHRGVEAWRKPRRGLIQILVEAAELAKEKWAETPSPYARRYGAVRLRRLILEAVNRVAPPGTAGMGQFDDLPFTESGDTDGFEVVRRDAMTFLGAHRNGATPPLPQGFAHDVLNGTAAIDELLAGFPHANTDGLSLAILREIDLNEGYDEIESAFERVSGEAACLAIEGPAHNPTVWFEWRRRHLDAWRYANNGGLASLVVLDATAKLLHAQIEAATPGRTIHLIETPIIAAPHERRLMLHADASRKKMLSTGNANVTEQGAAMLIEALRIASEQIPRPHAGRSIGIVSYKSVVDLLRRLETATNAEQVRDAASDGIAAKADGEHKMVVDAVGSIRAAGFTLEYLHFFAQRGINKLQTVDVLLVIGDPRPNLGAIAEEARALGARPEDAADLGEAFSNDRALAELEHAVGRARGIRRTSRNAVTVIRVGALVPPSWGIFGYDEARLEVAGAKGGRPPGGAADVLRGAARTVLDQKGAVCAAFLKWLAANSELCKQLAIKLGDDQVRAITDASPSAVRSAVADAATDLPSYELLNPVPRARGQWTWRAKDRKSAEAISSSIRQASKNSGT